MASIQKELASGIIYTAISKYSGIIISLAVAGVLARLIDPEEFGVVAIATVIISFFSIFSDLGIAPAIIQNKHLTEDKLNDIFSFTLWTGSKLVTGRFSILHSSCHHGQSPYFTNRVHCYPYVIYYLSTYSLPQPTSFQTHYYSRTKNLNL